MNLDQAIGNLSQILFQGRIEMPNGPLTAQEHQELSNNFNLLVARAKLADELEAQVKERVEQLKPDLLSPPEAVEPVVVEPVEEDQDERTE